MTLHYTLPYRPFSLPSPYHLILSLSQPIPHYSTLPSLPLSPLSYPTLPHSIPCTISYPALLSSPPLYPTIPSTSTAEIRVLVNSKFGVFYSNFLSLSDSQLFAMSQKKHIVKLQLFWKTAFLLLFSKS